MTPGAWVPDRRDIIWIDCNPQAGREMRDLHPMLVLSPRNFNERTSIVISHDMDDLQALCDQIAMVHPTEEAEPNAVEIKRVDANEVKS